MDVRAPRRVNAEHAGDELAGLGAVAVGRDVVVALEDHSLCIGLEWELGEAHEVQQHA